jgi:hypothetical protein
MRYLRAASLLVALAACVLLPACSSTDDFAFLGYTTRSQFDRGIRTVRVPLFRNRTIVQRVEFELTEAVVKQIELKTPWKVVSGDGADTELTGIVLNFNKRIVLQNEVNEIREGELTLGAAITWRDLRTGEVLSERKKPDGALPALPPPDPLAAPAGQQPLGVLVQRSASFVPELGESLLTARKRVVDELAEQIVSMMETPW